MDGEERSTTDPLSASVARLLAQPYRVGFFRAIALLERATPGAPRVGELGPVADEAVRFRHDPALTFSASDVRTIVARPRTLQEITLTSSGPIYDVTSTFLGLTGAVSPLPMYYAEEIIHEDDEHPTKRAFLDIFHHRILSLFYRVHTKFDFPGDYLTSSQDSWSRRVLALAGVDTFERESKNRLPLHVLLRLAPLLAMRSRTAAGLADALVDVLGETLDGAGITIDQFVGRWVTIEERQRIRLGVVNTVLGRDITIGRRVFDRGGKFSVVIGPLKRAAFRRFLPGGDALDTLRDVVHLIIRDPLDFDVELVLAPGEAPPLRIGMIEPSRLGMDSWVGVLRDCETRVRVPVPAVPNPDANTNANTNTNTNIASVPPVGTAANPGDPYHAR